MGVVLQIISDLLIGYGVNPSVINVLVMVVYIATFINIVYTVAIAISRVVSIFKVCKNFFTNLKLKCKKPPKSVAAEVDGSNNSLN